MFLTLKVPFLQAFKMGDAHVNWCEEPEHAPNHEPGQHSAHLVVRLLVPAGKYALASAH